MNGNGLQLMEIYMGIGGLEFGSGVTRSPGLVWPLITLHSTLHYSTVQYRKEQCTVFFLHLILASKHAGVHPWLPYEMLIGPRYPWFLQISSFLLYSPKVVCKYEGEENATIRKG